MGPTSPPDEATSPATGFGPFSRRTETDIDCR
jgi:hypothetical protein